MEDDGQKWRECVPSIIAIWLLANLLLVGLWDGWQLVLGNPGYTVSSVLRDWSTAYPILPFAIGLLVGHLLWR